MTLKEILNFRRSVRLFDKRKSLDIEKVKNCLELATLAPNSSNMQLWEFYHITNKEIIQKLVPACFDQSSVKTADQVVVFVTRQDLHRKRSKMIFAFEKKNIERNSPKAKHEKRIKDANGYYNLLMPFLYSRGFRLIGLLRKMIVYLLAPFRSVVYQVTESEMNAVVQKSCALASQTFMIAMSEQGYDTCPLEGFDSRKVKNILKLPCKVRINMVIPCGIRMGNEGIRGERYRVPFEEIYHQL
ncbi:nitroreductase family protein [Rhizosphaericola mali]|uniref:Nitroreductase family protein n=1 Tax=Rhizosphaericola mali TaxID=2545455 RepID=A0A5P2FWW5_9BACT|nr:nitroreductase family protein [Rhizosphaericola mali]QES87675.1 nitroreductase family protein [Rhizosphaericola mali]